jgi:dihydroorotate dehydrogenase
MVYKSLLKPLLFRLEAERAHDLIQKFAEVASEKPLLSVLIKALYNYQSPMLTQHLWGLTFRNPIGLAAGFDKNGMIPEAIEALGFGFTEVGSVTAKASIGNPRPRAFRLPGDKALINRMGLNNDGAKTVVKRLKNKNLSIPLGVNVAKTHNPRIMGDKAIQDYIYSFNEAQKVADYITINISCPNTTEGKTFEDPVALEELLRALGLKEDASITPTLIKFSSDLSREELSALLDICEDYGIDGYVAVNTSSGRDNLLTSQARIQAIGKGGLSGRPIINKSVQLVGWISEMTKGQKPIIGVGGIDSFETALAMLQSGADLLQIYTGLIYQGPGLVKTINKKLVQYLKNNELDSLLQIHKKTALA